MHNYMLQHYLEESARKYSTEKAVIDGIRNITYDEMDAKSNQIANQIIKTGFTHGSVVGIYLHKSIESIIAFLGVLKAGGAYIPMDSHYSPVERIKRIIELSKSEYLITDITKWNELNRNDSGNNRDIYNGIKVILVDEMLQVANREIKQDMIAENKPNIFCFDKTVSSLKPECMYNATENDLAYILYTSGSTGEPKGVMITHRNAITFIEWSIACFNPQKGTMFANHAPLHFDLSIFDIYVSLAVGGCVNLVPSIVMNNPRALIEWISVNNIEYWYSVPSVWVTIINYAQIDSNKLSMLKVILFAGEVFPHNFLKSLMNALPGRRYFNLYGPTETNVCTYYQVKNVDEIGDQPVPIGKACENTSVMALNEEMHEINTGETGELHVWGPGVAVGYYNNSQKTKESFRISPFKKHGNQPIYATGDIVKKISKESYQYIGRKDLMVKCAGYRIELQEIEKAFYQINGIREVVVVPYYREERGSLTLHAYVSFKEDIQLRITEIKKQCNQILPQYMIPDLIQILPEIPKNQNGKFDRQYLQKMCTLNNVM